MRKLVSWLLAWLFYWLGDLVSRPMNWFECMWWVYPAYNRLMVWSYSIQKWGGNCGPWKKSNG